MAKVKKYRDTLAHRLEIVKGPDSAESCDVKPGPSRDVAVTTTGTIKRPHSKVIPLKSYRERINFRKIVASFSLCSYFLFHSKLCQIISFAFIAAIR